MQNTANGSGESFSQLVQLYQYAETQMHQLKLNFATLMENCALQQKKLTHELRRESLSYINEEIDKLDLSTNDDSDTIKSKLFGCAEQVNATITEAITEFVDILNNAERMVNVVESKLEKEPESDDIDEINDEVDDILDEFKEKFEITVVPLVEGILTKLRTKLVSLRLDLKTCVDEILN